MISLLLTGLVAFFAVSDSVIKNPKRWETHSNPTYKILSEDELDELDGLVFPIDDSKSGLLDDSKSGLSAKECIEPMEIVDFMDRPYIPFEPLGPLHPFDYHPIDFPRPLAPPQPEPYIAPPPVTDVNP